MWRKRRRTEARPGTSPPGAAKPPSPRSARGNITGKTVSNSARCSISDQSICHIKVDFGTNKQLWWSCRDLVFDKCQSCWKVSVMLMSELRRTGRLSNLSETAKFNDFCLNPSNISHLFHTSLIYFWTHRRRKKKRKEKNKPLNRFSPPAIFEVISISAALLNLHGVQTFFACRRASNLLKVDCEQLQQMLQRTAKTSLADYFIKCYFLLLVDL